MSIFHLFLSFSSFFCKTLFSFFPYFRLSSSTFLYISSFLPHLPPFLLLVFPIFLSSFPSLLPLFLLSFLLSLSLPLLPLPLHFLSSFPTFPLYSPFLFFPYFLILSRVFLYISSISFLPSFPFFSSCFLYFCLPFLPHFVFLLSF